MLVEVELPALPELVRRKPQRDAWARLGPVPRGRRRGGGGRGPLLRGGRGRRDVLGARAPWEILRRELLRERRGVRG